MPLRDEELALRPPPGVSFTEWHQAKLAESRGHEFKAGLVLAAIGAGLYLIMGWTAGAIPGFIGVALLINALIARRSSRCGPTTESNPPQS